MDIYSLGEEIEVSFDLRGREYAVPGKETKYYNSLNAYKVESSIF